MHQDLLSFLALHFIPGIGSQTIKQLVSYFGSADQVFKTPRGKLLKIQGIGEKIAHAIAHENSFHMAEKELQLAAKHNTTILPYFDKQFPSRLKQIRDAPSLLYLKGNMNLENPKCVAIVGTRQATKYGNDCVEQLIESLISHQTLIISGLAYGIDIMAHRHALKCNLPTVAIMGSGVDVIYPIQHADTVSKMLDHNGGLISENPFGTKPDAHNFPQRNRIIAGLCDALIVVEAAIRGGALITAEVANSYSKDVFAFPGNVDKGTSAGCNNLIKSHKANLITNIQDLEYIMNWAADTVPAVKQKNTDLSDLEEPEQLVVKALLERSPLHLDEISWRTTIPVSMLAAILLNLEFKGRVKALPGKQFSIAN